MISKWTTIPKEHKTQFDWRKPLNVMKHVVPNIALLTCNTNWIRHYKWFSQLVSIVWKKIVVQKAIQLSCVIGYMTICGWILSDF
jgi:hypothetical protein